MQSRTIIVKSCFNIPPDVVEYVKKQFSFDFEVEVKLGAKPYSHSTTWLVRVLMYRYLTKLLCFGVDTHVTEVHARQPGGLGRHTIGVDGKKLCPVGTFKDGYCGKCNDQVLRDHGFCLDFYFNGLNGMVAYMHALGLRVLTLSVLNFGSYEGQFMQGLVKYSISKMADGTHQCITRIYDEIKNDKVVASYNEDPMLWLTPNLTFYVADYDYVVNELYSPISSYRVMQVTRVKSQSRSRFDFAQVVVDLCELPNDLNYFQRTNSSTFNVSSSGMLALTTEEKSVPMTDDSLVEGVAMKMGMDPSVAVAKGMYSVRSIGNTKTASVVLSEALVRNLDMNIHIKAVENSVVVRDKLKVLKHLKEGWPNWYIALIDYDQWPTLLFAITLIFSIYSFVMSLHQWRFNFSAAINGVTVASYILWYRMSKELIVANVIFQILLGYLAWHDYFPKWAWRQLYTTKLCDYVGCFKIPLAIENHQVWDYSVVPTWNLLLVLQEWLAYTYGALMHYMHVYVVCMELVLFSFYQLFEYMDRARGVYNVFSYWFGQVVCQVFPHLSDMRFRNVTSLAMLCFLWLYFDIIRSRRIMSFMHRCYMMVGFRHVSVLREKCNGVDIVLISGHRGKELSPCVMLPIMDQLAIARSNEGVFYVDGITYYYGITFSGALNQDLRGDIKIIKSKNFEDSRVDKVILARVGPNLVGVTPHVALHTQENLERCLHNRVYKNYGEPNYAEMVKYLDEFKPHLAQFLNLKKFFKVEAGSLGQYVHKFTTGKGFKTCVGETNKCIGDTEGRIKIEQVIKDLYEKEPRVFHPNTNEYNAKVGPAFAGVGILLRLCWNVNNWIYLSGGTESAVVEGLRRKVIESNIKGFKFYEGDYSSFDNTLCKYVLMYVYQNIYGEMLDEEIVALMIDKLDRTMYTDVGLTVTDIEGTMGSGQPDTLVTNSLINGILAVIGYCRVRKITVKYFFDTVVPSANIDEAQFAEYCEKANFKPDLDSLKHLDISDLEHYRMSVALYNDLNVERVSRINGVDVVDSDIYMDVVGDDNVVAISGDYNAELHTEYINNMFAVRLEFFQADEPEICSSIVIPAYDPKLKSTVWVLSPKPGRLLAKLCNVTKPCISLGLLASLKEKILGVYIDSFHVPFVSQYVSKVLSLMPEDIFATAKYHQYKSHCDYKLQMNDDTINYFLNRYSITMEQYNHTISMIDGIESLNCVVHDEVMTRIFIIDNNLTG